MKRVTLEETTKNEVTQLDKESDFKRYFIENVLQSVMTMIQKNVYIYYYLRQDGDEYIVFEDMHKFETKETIYYMQCITADSISSIVMDFANAITKVWG